MAMREVRFMAALTLLLTCAAGALLVEAGNAVASEVPVSKPAATRQVGPTPGSPSSSTSSVTERERRKLELEIRKLEIDTGTPARLANWLPMGTILVGVLAATIGVLQYLHDQRRQSEIRIQEQYSTNVSSLVGYVEAERSTSIRVVSALDNLKNLVPLMMDPTAQRERVTDLVATAVAEDLDFEDPRQVRFDALCLSHWPEYRAWLGTHPDTQKFILYRYRQALTVLAGTDPDYFRSLKVAPTGGFTVKQFIKEQDYLHFTWLLEGYRQHLSSLDEPQRSEAVQDFAAAVDNSRLAEDLFHRHETAK
jgi:hypothetical protein